MAARSITGQERAGPPVLALDDPRAARPELTGGKAAALASAAAAGLPVLPAVVLTTAAAGTDTDEVEPILREAWSRLSHDGERSLVVRSSSTVEDDRETSMAGLFTSVLDVNGWADFRRAIDTVQASASAISIAPRPGAAERSPRGAPMAVLVQPYLSAVSGGVVFGVDPVSGRADRLVVAATDRGPAALVSGAVAGARFVLSRHGRRHERTGENPAVLTRRQLRRLARLALEAERIFGGPQDIEWAFDGQGQLWLLQSRPITAVGEAGGAQGPVYGPGPVAETFPDPLAPLEHDLWAEPLRQALTHALALAGTVGRRRLRSSPVVVSVGGRLAADLELLGERGRSRSLLRRLDPRPPARRLAAAWRVGRLRRALPALAADVVERADADLLAQPPLDELSDAQLMALLDRARPALTALHGHEVLLGWVVDPGEASTTAASVAMRQLADARERGLSDPEIVAAHPTVLALSPPRIGSTTPLPATLGMPSASPPADPVDDRAAVLREALRLRARWLQELMARAAWELGSRLRHDGVLAETELVRFLHLDELRTAIGTRTATTEPSARRRRPFGPPLPARFRLTPAGEAVAVTGRRRSGDRGGTGAGGGRGMGRVHDAVGPPRPGDVLVVRTLDPDLAPLLPRLGGLVAETGSPLSHLAILAREYAVPTVVAMDDALSRLAPGSMVVVDGSTGQVDIVDDDDQRGVA